MENVPTWWTAWFDRWFHADEATRRRMALPPLPRRKPLPIAVVAYLRMKTDQENQG